MNRVLCLCCATTYDAGGDCPRVDELPHSPDLAVEVVRYLQQRGCEYPRPLDVRYALGALAALSGSQNG